MSHPEQVEFIKRTLSLFPEFTAAEHVVEIGSLNINGTIRDLIDSKRYLGVDIGIGDGVDFRCSGELLELPSGFADMVCSTECLEHAEKWVQLLHNIVRICKPGGLVLLTFAGPFRPCHGTVDSRDPNSSPFTENYYKNIDKDAFFSAITLSHCFDRYCFEANLKPGDSYFWGVRSSGRIESEMNSHEILLDRLARAQGQLGQALSRLAMANKKIVELERINSNFNAN
jgi:SAM-dependent methyltransferase